MLARILSLLNPRDRHAKRRARAAYGCIMAQSRAPVFYTDFRIRDDFDGRFEVLCLHGAIFLSALKDTAQAAPSPAHRRDCQKISQAYFDVMFENLDYALREMGVGDLGVPRRIKKYMMAFHGRAVAYDESLRQPNHAHDLAAIITRNVYFAHPDISADHVRILADYARARHAKLCQNLRGVTGAADQDGGALADCLTASFADRAPLTSGLFNTDRAA